MAYIELQITEATCGGEIPAKSDIIVLTILKLLQHIQGKIPGVVITQAGGDPNGDFIIRIRGSTSLEGQPPLVVIDAIDDFYKSINTINPSDIESYDVLKDASPLFMEPVEPMESC